MSKGVNKTISIGNLCADPETRYMPNGNAVTNIRIAMNDGYKDKNTGQQVDKTEFIQVVFFNKLGEIAGQYLKKGSKVYVEGSLRTRKWQGQDGSDRYTTEIVASDMQMLDYRADSAGGAGASWSSENGDGGHRAEAPPQNSTGNAYREASGGTSRKPPPSAAGSGFDDFDDDIPFN